MFGRHKLRMPSSQEALPGRATRMPVPDAHFVNGGAAAELELYRWFNGALELITPDNFREFVFTNAARLHTSLNPDFFTGTVVEEAVNKLMPPALAATRA